MPPIVEPPPLWPDQVRAVDFADRMDHCAFFYDMGTGKTRATIEAMKARKPRRTLVLCPKTVVPQWASQVKEFWQGGPQVLALQNGTGAKKEKKIREFGDGVVSINYDAAWRGMPKRKSHAWDGIAAALMEWRPDMVVCDESHRIKAHNTRTGLFAWEIGKDARWRLCLTGTPQPNNHLDLFGQMRFINDAVLGTLWSVFRAEYAILGNSKIPQMITGLRNHDKLKALVAPYCIEATAQGLPECLTVWRWGEMSSTTAKLYRDLQSDWIASVGGAGDVITLANALVELLRLQQLCGGTLKSDEGTEYAIETPKRDMLCDILDDAPSEPVVVFGVFKSDLRMVRAACNRGKVPRPYYELSGDANQLAEWSATIDTKREPNAVIGVNIQAGGTGINDLVRARIGVYVSTGFNWGNYAQSVARLHRPGQKRNVVLYHLGAAINDGGKPTIDSIVEKVLAAKGDNQAELLAAIRAHVK